MIFAYQMLRIDNRLLYLANRVIFFGDTRPKLPLLGRYL